MPQWIAEQNEVSEFFTRSEHIRATRGSIKFNSKLITSSAHRLQYLDARSNASNLYNLVCDAFGADRDPVLATTARRKYIPVGSTPTSMRVKAVVTNTEQPMPSKLTELQ